MNQWIFLRHGESTANQRRVFSGHQDVPLTDLGRNQALEAGKKLHSLLKDTPLAAVWSSDLVRAEETARLALTHASFDGDIRTDSALRERNLGAWQGKSIDDLQRSGHRDILLTWEGHAPGGESLADIALRAVRLLCTVQASGPVLIVAHGGLIRALLGLLDCTEHAEIGRVNIANAQPIERWIPDNRWVEIFDELRG